jgi:hydrogenase-4 component B
MEGMLAAVSVLILSGTAALLLSKGPRAATALGAGGAVLGCVVGLVPTLRVLLGAMPQSLRLAWDASHGAFWVAIDPLSAFFLLPVFGLSALAAVYGGNYLLPGSFSMYLSRAWQQWSLPALPCSFWWPGR